MMINYNRVIDTSNKGRLTTLLSLLMLKGAGYAALVVLVTWFTIAALDVIGGFLPDEARQAADPTPWSALDVPAPASAVVQV
jgi:hypothetical protein